MKLIVALLLTIFTAPSFASIEEDKKAGTCAMYLVLANKSGIPHGNATPQAAIAMADKESRALEYSKMYANKFREYQARKQSVTPLINEGVGSCYAIGLKLS
jgi:hypothetical protein